MVQRGGGGIELPVQLEPAGVLARPAADPARTSCPRDRRAGRRPLRPDRDPRRCRPAVAAPRGVASSTCGISIGRPITSALFCIQKALRVAPPTAITRCSWLPKRILQGQHHIEKLVVQSFDDRPQHVAARGARRESGKHTETLPVDRSGRPRPTCAGETGFHRHRVAPRRPPASASPRRAPPRPTCHHCPPAGGDTTRPFRRPRCRPRWSAARARRVPGPSCRPGGVHP